MNQITIVYDVVDEAAFQAAGNPLRFEHHGLKAHTVSTSDAMSTKEIPFKQWRTEEAKRLGRSLGAVNTRYYRAGKYPNLRVRRVNKRVVFVILDAVRPASRSRLVR